MLFRFLVPSGNATNKMKLVSIEVDHSDISIEDRMLIADRLDGDDIAIGTWRRGKTEQVEPMVFSNGKARRLVAQAAFYEALIEAIRVDHQRLLKILGQKAPISMPTLD